MSGVANDVGTLGCLYQLDKVILTYINKYIYIQYMIYKRLKSFKRLSASTRVPRENRYAPTFATC